MGARVGGKCGNRSRTYSTQCGDNSIGVGSAIETVIARRNPEPEFDITHAISTIGVANAGKETQTDWTIEGKVFHWGDGGSVGEDGQIGN